MSRDQALKYLNNELAKYHAMKKYGEQFEGEVYEIKIEPDKLSRQSKEGIMEHVGKFMEDYKHPFSFLIRDEQDNNKDLFRIEGDLKEGIGAWEIRRLIP
jgi:hypothetical protein